MVERIEGEIVFRDKATGQFRSAAQAAKNFSKSVAAAGKGTQGAAASLKQLNQVAGLLGYKLVGSTAPALKGTTAQLREVERAAAGAGKQLVRTKGAFGMTAAGADAFTRAATRGVAAIGFISPTAATASAQIVGLSNASAGMTLAIGAATVAAIALGTALFKSTRAAINFETSFRGIRKTVQGTEEQFAQLEKQNRQLAKSLGENVNTINQIGQTAGQLGIAVGEIAEFEKTVVKMAAATDLTANAAATAFGGFMAVLKLSAKDVDRLAAEIVELGNTYAGTESEIAGLLNRIAGAGAVLKMPAADLAAIAAAFSHVRVEQEAAGTAIQKVFLALQRAAVTGGEALGTFSTMLGISAQEFQRLVRTDPTEVFVRFVEALGKSGEEAQLWLKELGLTDQRLTRTFLKMAASGDVLRGAIERGTEANREGTAHTEEFEKALGTTAGQLRLAKAAFVDLGISIGDMFLPVIKEAAQTSVLFADVLQHLGDVVGSTEERFESIGVTVSDLVPHLAALSGTLKLLRGDLRGINDLAGPIAGNVTDVVDSLGTLGAVARRDEDAFSDLWKSALKVADPSAGLFEKTVRFIRGSSGEAADAIEDMAADAASAASELGGDLDGLTTDINEISDAAEDARKKLFSMFKEPTVEETKAKLAVLALRLELSKLQTQQAPLTEAQKEYANTLKRYLIPSAERLQNELSLIGDIEAERMRLAVGGLPTMEEQAAAIMEQAQEVANLNAQMEDVAEARVTVKVDTELAQEAITALHLKGDLLAAQAFAFDVDAVGEENALAAIEALMQEGNLLAAQTFTFRVRVDGVEAAMRQITALMQTMQLLAAQAFAFEVGVEGEVKVPPIELPDISDILAAIIADAQAMMDKAAQAAKGAKKEVDPLADGIISLSEAMEYGFTVSTAASAEWVREQEKLADRLWRTRVETEKIERFYSRVGAIRERALLELREAEVNAAKGTIDLRVELAKLYIVLGTSATMLKDAHQLLLEGQVAFAESVRNTNAEIIALQVILGEQGLADEAIMFRNALINLGEGFRSVEESMVEFLNRLSRAALDAAQQNFEALFARPTREQAETELRLAQLRRQRELLFVGGRTEEELKPLLEPLDREIEAIERSLRLRREEANILRLRAQLADRTLLTDQELMTQAGLLVGFIARESAIVDELNTRLFFEQLAVIGVTDALGEFRTALTAARDVLIDIQAPAFTASAAAGGARQQQLVVPGGPELNIEVNVNVDPQLENVADTVLRTVNRELEESLQRAGFGGSNVATGTYVPG